MQRKAGGHGGAGEILDFGAVARDLTAYGLGLRLFSLRTDAAYAL
jgi:hypothetical protein